MKTPQLWSSWQRRAHCDSLPTPTADLTCGSLPIGSGLSAHEEYLMELTMETRPQKSRSSSMISPTGSGGSTSGGGGSSVRTLLSSAGSFTSSEAGDRQTQRRPPTGLHSSSSRHALPLPLQTQPSSSRQGGSLTVLKTERRSSKARSQGSPKSVSFSERSNTEVVHVNGIAFECAATSEV
mmetsp:Transcript_66156/g.158243  ORF Transcript_66156/g.158243 Transcript_66156/m.158243 type:complete len:181 (+) Transcript_66156:169-711(+)